MVFISHLEHNFSYFFVIVCKEYSLSRLVCQDIIYEIKASPDMHIVVTLSHVFGSHRIM